MAAARAMTVQARVSAFSLTNKLRDRNAAGLSRIKTARNAPATTQKNARMKQVHPGVGE